MDTFIANNRDELIARCKTKVAQRPSRGVTQEQLKTAFRYSWNSCEGL